MDMEMNIIPPLTILYIEDDPAHAEIIMRNLAHHRLIHQIIHLSDGQQAIDYLFRKGAYQDPAVSPVPHLILLDLRLPKIDGQEVLERIKSNPSISGIPIIVLTTSHAEADMQQAYSHCVNSYLVKPLDSDQFTRLLNSLGHYWLAWNQYPTKGSS